MSGYTFFDENAYYCFCEAFEESPGVWKASVRFERKSDHTAQKTLIDAKVHKIVATFASREAAMDAASEFALDHAKRDDTGF